MLYANSGICGGANADVFETGQNTLTTVATSALNTFSGGGACATAANPTLLVALGGVDSNAALPKDGLLSQASVDLTEDSEPLPTLSSLSSGAMPVASKKSVISQVQLDEIVAVAISRWSETGLNDDQLATLRGLGFEVAKLGDLQLGEAEGNRIRVDNNAGGNGWFIDPSVHSDALFAKDTSATRSYTDPASAPAGSHRSAHRDHARDGSRAWSQRFLSRTGSG